MSKGLASQREGESRRGGELTQEPLRWSRTAITRRADMADRLNLLPGRMGKVTAVKARLLTTRSALSTSASEFTKPSVVGVDRIAVRPSVLVATAVGIHLRGE